MKKSIKKVALIIASVGCLTVVNAQKIAHLSLDSLVSMMPETKTAKDAAQNYLKGIEAEVMNMQTELQTKYEDYLKNETTMAEVVKKSKQEELNSLQKRIEDFRQQAQLDYQRKYGELTAPIMEKAKKGIELVAKEAGYKYVLDTSTGNVLYSEASDDILLAVKKKLDSLPAAVIPGTSNNNTPNKTPNKPAGTGTPKVK